MQSYLNEITQWTDQNLVLLNEEKSNYIIFSRSKSDFATRLNMNNINIDRMSVVKVLGVWLQEDLGWDTNTKEICKKAFSRVSVLSKLKYAGICTEDLITIYILFIRSLTEYCSVVFSASLTQKQSQKIEAIQATSLRVILDVNYVSYGAALEMCALDRLSTRRSRRQLSFARRCLNNEFTRKLFPENETARSEKFKVNFARTESYLKSAIPQCQRALNKFFQSKR